MSALINEALAGLSAIMTSTSVGKYSGCDGHNLPLSLPARQTFVSKAWYGMMSALSGLNGFGVTITRQDGRGYYISHAPHPRLAESSRSLPLRSVDHNVGACVVLLRARSTRRPSPKVGLLTLKSAASAGSAALFAN